MNAPEPIKPSETEARPWWHAQIASALALAAAVATLWSQHVELQKMHVMFDELRIQGLPKRMPLEGFWTYDIKYSKYCGDERIGDSITANGKAYFAWKSSDNPTSTHKYEILESGAIYDKRIRGGRPFAISFSNLVLRASSSGLPNSTIEMKGFDPHRVSSKGEDDKCEGPTTETTTYDHGKLITDKDEKVLGLELSFAGRSTGTVTFTKN